MATSMQPGRARANGRLGLGPQAARATSARIWILTDRRYLRQRMPLALLRWLNTGGWPATLAIADEGSLVTRLAPAGRPLRASLWSALQAGDVVVARTRHPFALALLREAEVLGARTYEHWATVVAVRDKASSTLALARAGVPVPPTYLASRPEDLAGLPARAFPLLLKPPKGDNAQGLVVVAGPEELEGQDWQHGLILAQPYLDASGVDLKLYVAGQEVWAVRRPSPLSSRNGTSVPALVTPALRKLAMTCGHVLGLRLFGVDVVESSAGLFVVDVNEFPNYTGIEAAPAAIGRLLLAEAAVTAAPMNGSPQR
jgi:ribosomal protein S6--L-glutamate ligase